MGNGTDDELDIDNVDYAILKSFYGTNEPLWKKRVYEYLKEQKDYLPIEDAVSVQTVGRRMDRMKYERYLENVVVSPNDTPRNQIIAYVLTEKGENALETHRDRLLKHALKQHLFPEETKQEMTKPSLIRLMQEQYEFSDDIKDQLMEYERDSIIAFLLIQYAQKEFVDILDHGVLEEHEQLLDNHPNIKDALNIQ